MRKNTMPVVNALQMKGYEAAVIFLKNDEEMQFLKMSLKLQLRTCHASIQETCTMKRFISTCYVNFVKLVSSECHILMR